MSDGLRNRRPGWSDHPAVADPRRYGEFLAAQARKSGVGYREALGSGIDLDAFERPGACTARGTLCLKIWPRRRTGLLWAYLLADDGAALCFPVFRGAGERPYAGIAAIPLGTRVEAVLAAGSTGRATCRHAGITA